MACDHDAHPQLAPARYVRANSLHFAPASDTLASNTKPDHSKLNNSPAFPCLTLTPLSAAAQEMTVAFSFPVCPTMSEFGKLQRMTSYFPLRMASFTRSAFDWKGEDISQGGYRVPEVPQCLTPPAIAMQENRGTKCTSSACPFWRQRTCNLGSLHLRFLVKGDALVRLDLNGLVDGYGREAVNDAALQHRPKSPAIGWCSPPPKIASLHQPTPFTSTNSSRFLSRYPDRLPFLQYKAAGF